MTKAQINQILRDTAKQYGFETTEETESWGFSGIRSEELNFTYRVRTTDNTDWEKRFIEETLTVTASVRKMGGEPTVEELLRTADEIRRAAELVADLQKRDLTWTDNF